MKTRQARGERVQIFTQDATLPGSPAQVEDDWRRNRQTHSYWSL